MAEFHFVEDYEKFVDDLLCHFPVDDAMSKAVGGGSFEVIGDIEAGILLEAGLKPGYSLIDLGCGSGRLAAALTRSGLPLRYLGIDIIQSLLNYAATKSSTDYFFLKHRELTVPAEDASIDMVAAFSLFTHLFHQESYLYWEDIRRVLKPEGKLVFSFLEFAEPSHWPIFTRMVDFSRTKTTPTVDMFIERGAISRWAEELGFDVGGFHDANASVRGLPALGQSVATLVKRR